MSLFLIMDYSQYNTMMEDEDRDEEDTHPQMGER